MPKLLDRSIHIIVYFDFGVLRSLPGTSWVWGRIWGRVFSGVALQSEGTIVRAYSSQTNQDDFLLRSANLHTAETRESPHCRESLSNISRVHAPNPLFPDALLAHWARAPFGSRSARLFSVRLQSKKERSLTASNNIVSKRCQNSSIDQFI